jgi:head-tail adaptor
MAAHVDGGHAGEPFFCRREITHRTMSMTLSNNQSTDNVDADTAGEEDEELISADVVVASSCVSVKLRAHTAITAAQRST